jgi:hypothetical protein
VLHVPAAASYDPGRLRSLLAAHIVPAAAHR